MKGIDFLRLSRPAVGAENAGIFERHQRNRHVLRINLPAGRRFLKNGRQRVVLCDGDTRRQEERKRRHDGCRTFSETQRLLLAGLSAEL